VSGESQIEDVKDGRAEGGGNGKVVIYTQQCILFFHWDNTIVTKSQCSRLFSDLLSGQISNYGNFLEVLCCP
jgi:hypothetical protein